MRERLTAGIVSGQAAHLRQRRPSARADRSGAKTSAGVAAATGRARRSRRRLARWRVRPAARRGRARGTPGSARVELPCVTRACRSAHFAASTRSDAARVLAVAGGDVAPPELVAVAVPAGGGAFARPGARPRARAAATSAARRARRGRRAASRRPAAARRRCAPPIGPLVVDVLARVQDLLGGRRRARVERVVDQLPAPGELAQGIDEPQPAEVGPGELVDVGLRHVAGARVDPVRRRQAARADRGCGRRSRSSPRSPSPRPGRSRRAPGRRRSRPRPGGRSAGPRARGRARGRARTRPAPGWRRRRRRRRRAASVSRVVGRRGEVAGRLVRRLEPLVGAEQAGDLRRPRHRRRARVRPRPRVGLAQSEPVEELAVDDLRAGDALEPQPADALDAARDRAGSNARLIRTSVGAVERRPRIGAASGSAVAGAPPGPASAKRRGERDQDHDREPELPPGAVHQARVCPRTPPAITGCVASRRRAAARAPAGPPPNRRSA